MKMIGITKEMLSLDLIVKREAAQKQLLTILEKDGAALDLIMALVNDKRMLAQGVVNQLDDDGVERIEKYQAACSAIIQRPN